MICQKCNNEGVQNQVLGKTFYYCRTCKDEISLSDGPTYSYDSSIYGGSTYQQFFKPKFKVGDRVRSLLYGRIGKITRVDANADSVDLADDAGTLFVNIPMDDPMLEVIT